MKKMIMSIKKYSLLIVVMIAITSCTKNFEEIDTNSQGFTTASDGSLFNNIISTLQLGWNEQFYINNEILYKQTQLAALTKEAWGNYSIGTEEIWNNFYTVLPEVRELEKRFEIYGDEAGYMNMRAMLKIVLAMKAFKVTDLFGDIPLSEAGYGFQNLNLLHPKYDSQRDIYITLLSDLKWADENINDTAAVVEPFTTFIQFDKLFNGDMTKWRKLANSLRFRHAMRIAEKEPVLAGEIIDDLIVNERPVFLGYDFLTPVLESACLWPAAMGFKNESVNWSFREHNNLRMGSNIWHQLSFNDSLDGSGIFDPRTYIFFETNMDEQWKAFPQIPDESTPASAGIPYGSHRDNPAGYTIKGDCNYSPFNYFVIRDEDYMPIIIITGAEIHFLKAEAYFRGIGVGVDQDMADIEYMNGINSSVEWWQEVAANLKLPLSGMAFPDYVIIPSTLNAASVLMKFGSWNATTDQEKLKFIYTQRMIDSFRQPWEVYALARRTGLTPREGDPIGHYRLPYPTSEKEYNTENWSKAIANQGGDTPDVKIWWIP
jgi:hypothetical protein